MKETNLIQLGNGREFAVFDRHGRIYNNIEDKDLLKVIDSRSLQAINSLSFITMRRPTGMAI